MSSKLKKYSIEDAYLNFYFKFIEAQLPLIQKTRSSSFFQQHIKPVWQPWLGLAFERFCLKHAFYLAEKMEFAADVTEMGPLFERKPSGFQIDLLYRRQDRVIVLCEIKFSTELIGTKIIPELEQKIKRFTLPRGYSLEKALISVYGPSPALLDSEYFQHSIQLKDIFELSA